MSNPSKAKGTKFESDVVAYLRDHGHPNVERKAQQGANDCGDITGVPFWTFELKATKSLDLAGALAEAETERVNAGTRFCAAIIKRRGKTDPGQAYVVQTLEQWTREHGSTP